MYKENKYNVYFNKKKISKNKANKCKLQLDYLFLV